ncbi:MAG: tetratricopeptide repeat protein [Bacteroidales bacterium]|nr:tetratricopeptide repeat protein [Bacteroidales bacterium]
MARKTPTQVTIKRLFALSGNTCAFQNCKNKLVEDETILGEVCHIESANNAARHNPKATDDELRSFENLILMCGEHHKIIDANETEYPTTRIKQWKKEHEEKYSNGEYSISDDNVDKILDKIENQYNLNQKAEKFNVNIIYNEAVDSIQVEQAQQKEASFENIPETIFENKLKNDRKPSRLFTGRKDKLLEIENAFNQNEITTLTGIGGIGKTELILKFIDSFQKDRKEKVTWQDFIESTNFDNFIVASGFGIIIQSNKTEREKFSAFIDKINEHQRIIIWDNFHDNTDNTFCDFLDFANGRLTKSKIIIISRTNEKTSLLKNIKLTDFKESFLYAKALKDDRYPDSELRDEEIKSICKYVKGHPLAIELSLNLCQSMSVEKVIGKLSEHKKGIDELSQRLFEDILDQESTSQAEKELLYQFSIFKEGILEEAVEVIFGDKCFFGTLPLLKDKYLIEYEQKHYVTHPLIREFCYQKLENKKELHAKASAYFIIKRCDKLDTLHEERIFYHLRGAEKYNEIAQTIEKYGRDFIKQAFFDLLQEMIACVNEKMMSLPLHDILLGDICDIKGEWDNALKYFEKAKDNIIDEEFAVEGLLKYGDIYRKRGNNERALGIFQEAKKISKEKDFQKYIAWSYNNIAIIKEEFGKSNETLELYKEALEISRKLNIKEDIASLYNNIGVLYNTKEFGEFNVKRALEYHEKSLKISMEIGDKFHIANSYNNIGNIYYLKEFKNYNLNRALEYHEKSLKIKLDIGDKPGIAYAYNNIGNIYYLKEFKNYNLNRALEYHEKSLKIRLEIGDKPGIANSYWNIGYSKSLLKEYEIAFVNMFKAYALNKQLQGKHSLIFKKNNINFLRKDLGKDIFIKYANLAIEKLEPEFQKEIELSEFLNEPATVEKKPERNEIIKVKYSDGHEEIGKYKKFKNDIESGKCKISTDEETEKD